MTLGTMDKGSLFWEEAPWKKNQWRWQKSWGGVCVMFTRSQEMWKGDLSTGYCQFVKPDNGKNVLTVDA